jgi:hypothetical protein
MRVQGTYLFLCRADAGRQDPPEKFWQKKKIRLTGGFSSSSFPPQNTPNTIVLSIASTLTLSSLRLLAIVFRGRHCKRPSFRTSNTFRIYRLARSFVILDILVAPLHSRRRLEFFSTLSLLRPRCLTAAAAAVMAAVVAEEDFLQATTVMSETIVEIEMDSPMAMATGKHHLVKVFRRVMGDGWAPRLTSLLAASRERDRGTRAPPSYHLSRSWSRFPNI